MIMIVLDYYFKFISISHNGILKSNTSEYDIMNGYGCIIQLTLARMTIL